MKAIGPMISEELLRDTGWTNEWTNRNALCPHTIVCRALKCTSNKLNPVNKHDRYVLFIIPISCELPHIKEINWKSSKLHTP
jgi:hypothetical protein